MNESLIDRGLLLLIIKGSHLVQVHHLREDVADGLPSIQHVTSRVFIVVREQLRVLRSLQPFDHVLQLNQLVLDASFPTSSRRLLIELGSWSLVSAALIIFLLLVLTPIRILVATQATAVIVAIRIVVIDDVLVSHILYHNWLLLGQEQRMMAVKAK